MSERKIKMVVDTVFEISLEKNVPDKEIADFYCKDGYVSVITYDKRKFTKKLKTNTNVEIKRNI